MADDDGLIENFEDVWTIGLEDIEFGEVVGRGAFGEVYKGYYLGTEVAIKKLSIVEEDDELYLQREVSALKSMRHPNIVTFMGAAYEGNDLYIVTEFVTKGALRSVLKNQSVALNWQVRGRIALDIACAMAYLHSKNIIFRDLKSKNVLIDATNRAKMCDFGFARLNEKRGARAMTLCGTDDWMAPEVILGMEYDAKADVFSFGIVLLEIITREKVSNALQRSAVHGFELDIGKARLLLPQDCPSSFADLAFDCCKYKPEDRPSFKDVVKRLSEDIKQFPSNVPQRAGGNRGGPNMRMRGMRGAPRGNGAPGGPNRGAPGSPRGSPAPRGTGSPVQRTAP